MQVISFCLFYPEKSNISYEYFLGLLYNLELRKQFFSEWYIHLHVSLRLKRHPLIQYVQADPMCIIFWRKEKGLEHDKLWRYEPFFNPQVKVCIARDVDSFLTLRDRFHVDQWLQHRLVKRRNSWLVYTEYTMEGAAMGGGIGYKGTLKLSDYNTAILQEDIFGTLDENFLYFLQKAAPALEYRVVLRMDEAGQYFEIYSEGVTTEPYILANVKPHVQTRKAIVLGHAAEIPSCQFYSLKRLLWSGATIPQLSPKVSLYEWER